MKLAVMGDLHYACPPVPPPGYAQQRDAFYRALFARFFGCGADMHVALGDVTQTGGADEWRGVLGLLRAAGAAPASFRLILGNHDTLAQPKAAVLRAAGQPRYAAEAWPGCRAIFLDTTKEMSPHDHGGVMDAEQVAWLGTLEPSPDGLALVFGHHPLPNTTARSDRPMMFIEDAAATEAALARLGGRLIYLNGHNHSHSIVRRGAWTFVQSASALCVPSFRTLEVAAGRVRVRTVMLGDAELDALAATVRAATPGYWSNPEAVGGAGDHEVDVPLG